LQSEELTDIIQGIHVLRMRLCELEELVDVVGVADSLILDLVLLVFLCRDELYLTVLASLHVEFLIYREVLLDSWRQDALFHHFP
jgi:hypothetical protein